MPECAVTSTDQPDAASTPSYKEPKMPRGTRIGTIQIKKTIAGFAYTSSKKVGNPNERVMMETFAKTQDVAKAKLLKSKRYFYEKENLEFRFFSVHLTLMNEVKLNLDGTEGLPVLDDDDEEPEVKMINGRVVLEDMFV
jgi:hypothetical protein